MRKDDHLIYESYVEEGLKDIAAAGLMGLGALTGQPNVQAQQPAAIERSIAGPIYQDSDFREHIKFLENGVKSGLKKDGRWYQHPSPEGGLDTIAYGHKLKPGENFSKGLSQAEAEKLLSTDIIEHEKVARYRVDKKYGEGTFDRLDNLRKQMITELAFNLGGGGVDTFKNYVKGILTNDKALTLKEHKRSYIDKKDGKRKPLTQRNNYIVQHFINKMQENATNVLSDKGTKKSTGGEIIIKQGDTLSKLARDQGINLNDLLKANPGIDPRRLQIGQKLKLP